MTLVGSDVMLIFIKFKQSPDRSNSISKVHHLTTIPTKEQSTDNVQLLKYSCYLNCVVEAAKIPCITKGRSTVANNERITTGL